MFYHERDRYGPWVDLRPFWDWSEFVANQRHQQKQTYGTHLPLNKMPDHVGVRGEIVYACMTGLAMDWRLRADGDHGVDFSDGTGVKASTSDKPKYHLILNKPEKHWCERYVLMVIDELGKRGCMTGWETVEALRSAETFNFGYGERLAIPMEQLRAWHTLPAVILRAKAMIRRSQRVLDLSHPVEATL